MASEIVSFVAYREKKNNNQNSSLCTKLETKIVACFVYFPNKYVIENLSGKIRMVIIYNKNNNQTVSAYATTQICPLIKNMIH